MGDKKYFFLIGLKLDKNNILFSFIEFFGQWISGEVKKLYKVVKLKGIIIKIVGEYKGIIDKIK